jgi:hypothetical protein
MQAELQRLHTKLEKLEKELEKVRGCSPLTDGWQTQRYAKKSRKWDMLAQEKMKLLQLIDDHGHEQNEY